ncbi:MAG TPA: YafY family protein [Phototrophicaceae bacterium]|jgi:predicted DNA-binding transcriptional regulator YafY|nr:YafY family protein [Phototrophicaceae bacterium]
MNRTDRLLAIVLEIQAKRHTRAEDLAATFEVTKRTIYRDIQALSESGVPIVGMPGEGYSLVEGYFLPPLTFTADEAIMLLLGTDFAGQNFDAQYRSAAQAANHKIITVLPDKLRREVEYLASSIRFIALNGSSAYKPETLQQLRRAIIQRRTVRFRYYARDHVSVDKSDTSSHRDADPYALIHVGGVWLLIAYCHLRHDRRNFRLDRMEDFVVLDQTFTRPADFTIQPDDDSDERTVIVRALFDPATARRVREIPSFFQTTLEDHPDGLLVTLTVQHPGEVLNWLLSWGSHVRVLDPESLQTMLAHEAAGILKNHPLNDFSRSQNSSDHY